MLVESSRGQETERKILIALITCTEFLSRIAYYLEKDSFRSVWSNLLGEWCVKHYTKFQKAPNKQIESLFQRWAESGKDKDTVKIIERFLSSLSGEYEKLSQDIDVPFLVDLAEKHLNEVKLDRLKEEIQARAEQGSYDLAIEKVQAFQPIELSQSPGINILLDKQVQRAALESRQKTLISYPGPAGEFFGAEFAEDSFVGIMAQTKGMKSWTLLDLAWRAMRQKRRVAYFQIGDLSRNQIMRRFMKRAVYRPLYPKLVKYPIGIVLPVGNNELAMVEYMDKTYEKEISWPEANRAFTKFGKKYGDNLRLFYYPTKTISMQGIKDVLERLDKESWKAEVVIIDYPENLAPVNSKMDKLDQIADTWAMGRQISEKRNCCVVVVSQTNKEGFKSWVLTRNNFRGNLMILAHVTAFLGINCTDEEKANSLVRYNFIARREEEFNERKCLWCAACLDCGNPVVVSSL